MDENMNYSEQNAAQPSEQPSEQQPYEPQPQENGFTMYDNRQYYQQQVPQWGAPYTPQQPPVQPKPKKQKKTMGSGAVIALALCCAILGGAMGFGGSLLANRLSGNGASDADTSVVYEGTREPVVLNTSRVDTSELKTPAGNLVPCYDLERTVCDVIRSRNKLGTETFLAALKLYAANPKKDLNKLNSYAKKMRVANILRQYLEVLL